MRKLIVSTNLTLDGFTAAPDGSLDWHFGYWDNEAADALSQQLACADTLVLGRRTYQTMAAFWTAGEMRLSCLWQDYAFIAMINSYKRIVLSKTLRSVKRNNTRIFTTLQALQDARAGAGKDMLVLGSGTLVASLVAAGLVDEHHIWLHPIAIGSGIPLFQTFPFRKMVLLNQDVLSSGIVQLQYRYS